jgi:hypothetical protein
MTVNQCPCGRHELHTTLEIGGWTHGPNDPSTVREWTTRADFWDEQHREMPAETMPAGTVRVINGVHRLGDRK